MIFLDAASTTEPLFFRSDYKQYWFNSNMPYAYTEKRKLQEARDRIKKCLGVKDGLILFEIYSYNDSVEGFDEVVSNVKSYLPKDAVLDEENSAGESDYSEGDVIFKSYDEIFSNIKNSRFNQIKVPKVVQ